MDNKTQEAINAGKPMTIIRLAKDGSVISKEHYNMENISLSDFQMKQLARTLLSACEKFYSNPENVKKYEAWKVARNAAEMSE